MDFIPYKAKEYFEYVGKINHISNANIINRKNYDLRSVKNTNKETENLRLNNKYNKINYSNMLQRKKLYLNYEQRVYEPEQLDKLYCNV